MYIDNTHKELKIMLTLKIRIKDKHSPMLIKLAGQVNFVWNYVNSLSYTHLRRKGKFFSSYDLQKYTSGATTCGIDLHSQTIQSISDEYVRRRNQFRKAKLAWRVSKGAKSSLGWIPFKEKSVQYTNGQIRYGKEYFNIWDSYGLSKYTIKAGCFSQDARGRWYVCLNVVPKVPTTIQNNKNKASIGIDLGLKDFATISTGEKIEAKQYYRKSEDKLKIAQRAKNKQRVRNIHAKIKNQRNDFQHKLSRHLVNNHSEIYVGNVNASALSKTNLAKSVLDAAWSSFRTMLRYKCENANVLFKELNEKYTTQTCSICFHIGDSSPRGRIGLRIREWRCVQCGTLHDRDINAALNILAVGHGRLVVGIQ
jgi:putative transposase